MKAVVVYESHWGNTAAIARAIAEGLGEGVRALNTSEATGEALAGVDLIVAGAPIIGFRLPTEKMIRDAAARPGKGPAPDLSHPVMRVWLETVPAGRGGAVAFESGFKLSPGGSRKAIIQGLGRAGYRQAAKGQRFLVHGSYGPVHDGELDRARAWGAELAKIKV